MNDPLANIASARQIAETVESVIAVAVRLLAEAGKPDKQGGYFAATELAPAREEEQPDILAVAEGPPSLYMLLRVGHSPGEKVVGRITVATEKCQRLHSLPHLTSYETRDPVIGLWGGGVKGKNFVFAFSGLPELWDEAAMFVLAILLNELSEKEVLAQISEERNPHLRPLLAATQE